MQWQECSCWLGNQFRTIVVFCWCNFICVVSHSLVCKVNLSWTWRGHEPNNKLVTTRSTPLRSRKPALIPTSMTTAHCSHSTPRNSSSVQHSNCIIRYLPSGSLKSETILVPSDPKNVVFSPPVSWIISRSSHKCVSREYGHSR